LTVFFAPLLALFFSHSSVHLGFVTAIGCGTASDGSSSSSRTLGVLSSSVGAFPSCVDCAPELKLCCLPEICSALFCYWMSCSGDDWTLNPLMCLLPFYCNLLWWDKLKVCRSRSCIFVSHQLHANDNMWCSLLLKWFSSGSGESTPLSFIFLRPSTPIGFELSETWSSSKLFSFTTAAAVPTLWSPSHLRRTLATNMSKWDTFVTHARQPFKLHIKFDFLLINQ